MTINVARLGLVELVPRVENVYVAYSIVSATYCLG
jgi:hypothetical protein